MGWTDKQKQIAARAAQAAGLGEEHRKLLLRQFPRSLFDRNGRATNDPSSTSSRLTNSDFEHYMAHLEHWTGGQILHFGKGYWQGKAQDDLQRFRRRCLAIAARLESRGLLEPGGAGLRGWISKRVTRGQTEDIERLDYHGLRVLHDSLSNHARRHGVQLRD